MKVFISQPMANKTYQQIRDERDTIKTKLQKYGYEVVDSLFTDDESDEISKLHITNDNVGIWYLGKSIMKLAECNVIYMHKDWNKYRGCIIEHDVALAYGLKIFEES